MEVHVPGIIDLRTTLLIIVMSALIVGNILAYIQNIIPLWAAFIIATFAMNLSFTAWHEPAHGNFSKSAFINNVVGWISSFISVYPGYFKRKKEHLLHHKYQGEADSDPVYPRLQTSFWKFPIQLITTALKQQEKFVKEMKLSTGEFAFDMLSNLLVLGILAFSYLNGFFWPVFLLWVVPRILVFGIHAIYICWLPHSKGGKGFEVYRVRKDTNIIKKIFKFFTMYQNYHGVHHMWTSIPWHKYEKVFGEKEQELVTHGVKIIG